VRQMTEQNMINAFGGESMAHLRYRLFARQADKIGYPNVADSFAPLRRLNSYMRVTTTVNLRIWTRDSWPTAWEPSDRVT
jgi:rubrerythrin